MASQRLQTARQDLSLAAALERLDKYELLIRNDLSYRLNQQQEGRIPKSDD